MRRCDRADKICPAEYLQYFFKVIREHEADKVRTELPTELLPAFDHIRTHLLGKRLVQEVVNTAGYLVFPNKTPVTAVGIRDMLLSKGSLTSGKSFIEPSWYGVKSF